MNESENLSERKRKILINSVNDYIQSAVPITSAFVKENYLKDISTATLRNELNALEAMGYLKQLHTSSGRVPTTKAYRYYVDEVLKDIKYKNNQLDVIKNEFSSRANNLSNIIENIAKTISKATNYPTVVVMNNLQKLIIEEIKIIPLIDFSALLLIQTNGGVINSNIGAESVNSEEDYINAAKILNEKFKTKSIAYMIENIENAALETTSLLEKYKEIFESVILTLKQVSQSVKQGGVTKLLNCPEYNSVEKAQEIFSLIEDENKIKEVISCSEDGISVSIGSENEEESLKECSVVRAPIQVDGETVASIGVIGPKRMDYALIAGAISYVKAEITKQNLIAGNKGESDVKKEDWSTSTR